MTFKDLLEQFSFDEVAQASKPCGNGMLRNRPHSLTWRAGEKSIIRYRK